MIILGVSSREEDAVEFVILLHLRKEPSHPERSRVCVEKLAENSSELS